MAGKTTKRGSAPKRRTAAMPTTSRPATGRKVKRLTPTKTKSAPQSKRATTAKKTSKPKPAAKSQKPKKQAPSNTGARAKEKARPRTEHRTFPTRGKSITFTLSAPTSLSVSIAGTFNNWEPQAMTKGLDGLWRSSIQLLQGIYQYRFLVDNVSWQDPNNPRTAPNELGGFNSICEML
jgi:hypothetical protein